jgi:hypothetical protein
MLAAFLADGGGCMRVGWGLAAVCITCITCVVGCASIPERTKRDLTLPVECENADLQLARMARDHAAPGERFVAGLQGILPPAVLISLGRDLAGKPRGIYLDHWRVAFGQYNEKIEARIDQTHEQCKR